MELAAMLYFLSMGLSFDIASTTLKTLKDKEAELFDSGKGSRWMLLFERHKRSLSLVAYDREQAIASLDEGKPLIPVWLDVIYQQLEPEIKARIEHLRTNNSKSKEIPSKQRSSDASKDAIIKTLKG